MQFYDSSQNQAICQKIDFLCDSSDTTYPRVQKTREVNNSLESLVGEIISADGTWQYDDTNYTDLPVGTATLVEAQESYSFASEYLKIERIKIKDVNGRWLPLEELDEADIELSGFTIEEYFANTGLPTHFDILGDTVRLYPAPVAASVTLTAGLKVHFKRTASLFTVASDTSADTQNPGLPSPYHEILAYMGAIPYCMKFKKDRVALYEKRVETMKKNIIDFYAQRHLTRRKKIITKSIRFR